MARSSSTPSKSLKKMTFEEAAEELESIIDQIESGEIGLEQALKERKRGDQLIQHCRSLLDVAEQELVQAQPEDEAEEESETSS